MTPISRLKNLHRFRFAAALLAAATVVWMSGCGKPDQPEKPTTPGEMRRYPVKSGHIHYEYSRDQRGSEDLYFDDYGLKEARIGEYDRFTESAVVPTRSLTISRGAEVASIDKLTMAGTFHKIGELDSLLKLEHPPSPRELSEINLKRLDFTMIGTDTLLGKPVEVWRQGSGLTTVYLWEALPLKRVVKAPTGGGFDMVATLFDTTTPVDSTLFEIPQGVRLKAARR